MSSGRSTSDGRSDREGAGTLILAPLRFEALIVRSAMPGAHVQATGMGPARARAAADGLSRQAGSGLLILGFCGSLEPNAVPGEVVLAERVSSSFDVGGPSETGAASSLGGEHPEASGGADDPVACAGTDALATALGRAGLQVRRGAIVCVSRPALGRHRAELRERSGAIAVDMESSWLAAGATGRPVAVVRVIIDSPSHELLRPRAVVGAVRAMIALRRVAAALHDWPCGL